MKRFFKFAGIYGLTIALAMWPAAAQAEGVGEFQIKALFIYNFAKFVEWPPEVFSSAHDPLTICIVGQDPFGNDIDQELKGKTINSRELIVRRIPKADDPKGCQVLFLGSLDQRRVKQMMSSVATLPVLTVGESEVFNESGIVIGFVMEGNKVRFDINLEAAERARLKISSKLLNLARTVKEPVK